MKTTAVKAIEVAITLCHMVNNTAMVCPQSVIDHLVVARQELLDSM